MLPSADSVGKLVALPYRETLQRWNDDELREYSIIITAIIIPIRLDESSAALDRLEPSSPPSTWWCESKRRPGWTAMA